jgi:hypothetical protein
MYPITNHIKFGFCCIFTLNILDLFSLNFTKKHIKYVFCHIRAFYIFDVFFLSNPSNKHFKHVHLEEGL